MKLLLVADIHYTLKQWDWLKIAAPHFDAVIIAGDMLEITAMVDKQVQILITLKYLRHIATTTQLVVASGNHDLDRLNAVNELHAYWLQQTTAMGITTDGQSIVLDDGILVSVCPWWDGPNTQLQVHTQLQHDATIDKNQWIWVYHAPPEGSPLTWTGNHYYGDPVLRDWLHELHPDIVLCGHLHNSPFIPKGSWIDKIDQTWLFNSGKQIGPIPTYTIIDTTERLARWHSMEGCETARLEGELQRRIEE